MAHGTNGFEKEKPINGNGHAIELSAAQEMVLEVANVLQGQMEENRSLLEQASISISENSRQIIELTQEVRTNFKTMKTDIKAMSNKVSGNKTMSRAIVVLGPLVLLVAIIEAIKFF